MEKNGENGSGPASLGAETDVDQHPDSLGSRIGQNFDQIQRCRVSCRSTPCLEILVTSVTSSLAFQIREDTQRIQGLGFRAVGGTHRVTT